MRYTVGILALVLLLQTFVSGCAEHKPAALPQSEPTASESPTTGRPAKTSTPAFVSPHRIMVSLASGESLSAGGQDYLLRLQERLARGWQPIPSDKQYSVAIEFTITRPGLCADAHVISATCNKKAMEKTIDMIRMQAPFEALPEDFKDAPVTFRCDFVYLPQKAK